MKPVVNTVKIVVGIVLVTIGLIGGLIPIFQGWLLGSVYPPIRKWTQKIVEKVKKKMRS
jgi:hypothetical protein